MFDKSRKLLCCFKKNLLLLFQSLLLLSKCDDAFEIMGVVIKYCFLLTLSGFETLIGRCVWLFGTCDSLFYWDCGFYWDLYLKKNLSFFDLGEVFLSVGCWLLKNPDSILKAVRVLFYKKLQPIWFKCLLRFLFHR